MRSYRDPVAIVGIACRFASAASRDAYWSMLRSGVEGTGSYPGGRSADIDRFFASAGTELGPPTARGGFLDGVDRFDAEFFGIAPREAQLMDPQQRVLLEVTWEAMEDAGETLEGLAGTRTGVFVGIWSNGYERIVDTGEPVSDVFTTPGNGLFGASGRVAFAFDLQGPELSVNAACASSLTAMHQARMSLLHGECDVAIVAGVNAVLRPDITVGFARAGILSRDGRCKFGDASADGFVRSEGCGVLVLKRMSRAVDDSDRIYALLRGSAINNNGAGSGTLTRPNRDAQRALVRRALDEAELTAGEVGYVEAHGTGTYAGDQLELAALSDVFGDAARSAPCRVGSAKSNIGHAEAAAGVAGVIKAALALHHDFLPATLHVREPNPAIDWSDRTLALQVDGEPWPADVPRRAGISSFGLTGGNAHAILEAAPVRSAPPPELRDAFALPLSARSPAALRALCESYAVRFDGGLDPADACYTAACRRSALPLRYVALGANARELASALHAFARDGGETTAVAATPARSVFVFPGQGAQWAGMGRRLSVTEPAFRASLDATDAAIRSEAGWSPIEALHDDDPSFGIERIQPMLFAIQTALAATWRSFGVAPSACVGHSMGEVAAAHVAGALTLADAVAVICRRSALMKRLAGRGAMALVELSMDDAARRIAAYDDVVSIAVSNGPRSTVLSGEPHALDAIIAALEADDVFVRRIAVEVAAHSPQMEAIADELRDALRDVTPRRARTPLFSTMLGRFVDGTELDAEYWIGNLRRPVRFFDSIGALIARGERTFIEASPHPTLVQAIADAADAGDADGSALLALPSMRRDEPEQHELLTSVSRLFERGFAIDWRGVYRTGSLVDVPSYPWQRARHWIDGGESLPAGASLGGHPLLGTSFSAANGDRIRVVTLDAEALPWLKDHAVGGSVLLPGSAYVESALAIAREDDPSTPAVLANLTLREPILLAPRAAVQIVASPKSPGRETIRFFARDTHASEWSEVASGEIARGVSGAVPPPLDLAAVERARATPTRDRSAHAEELAARGYDFGPAFRSLAWYAVDGSRLLGEAELPQNVNVAGYALHPALLDAAFQALAAAMLDSRGSAEQLLPYRFEHARIEDGAMPTRAVLVAQVTDAVALRGDVAMYGDDGTLLAHVAGLTLRAVSNEAKQQGEDVVFRPDWIARPRGEAHRARPRWLLVAGSATATADALARRLREGGVHVDVVATADSGALRTAVETAREAAERTGIVDLRALDLTAEASLADVAAHGCAVAALAVQLDDRLRTSRLWLVSRGACATPGTRDVDVAAASVWGLGATIANERPELACTLIDLAASGDIDVDALYAEIAADDAESRVALRGATRFVWRLTAPESGALDTTTARPLRGDEKLEIRSRTLGTLDDMTRSASPRRAPGPDEVEIAVEAAGLNFLDVVRTMGMYASAPPASRALGVECAGRVVRVGDNVRAFRAGDEVIALSPAFHDVAALTSHLVTREALVARKPRNLSFAEAAALPCVYVTAWYAIAEVARMRAGETLLVHSAAGGVGLAAIGVARALGIDVIGTAGTPQKRAYLRERGIEHVLDSRAPGFADTVRAATGGRGADAVLNSLTGAAIPDGLAALAPYGRFLEIGKRDMWADARVGLGAFLDNRSFSGIDILALVQDRPDVAGAILRTVAAKVEAAELPALPTTTFAASDAADAFRTLSGGGHIGKIAIDTRASAALVEDAAPVVRDDGTYLVTGGAGALGLAAAAALASAGARSIVLVSRRAPDGVASDAIAALRRDGVHVAVRSADIGDEGAVAALLDEIRTTLPPLRGVVHAAGVLADALLEDLDARRFDDVMRGKVGGAVLLDRCTREDPVDLFVLFSSAAAMLGSPGQGNYAAANAMLDALAERRAAQGLPALSIAWGPWADIGLAAADANRGHRLGAHGLRSLSPREGSGVLLRLARARGARFAAMRFDVARWCRAFAPDDRALLFERVPRASETEHVRSAGLAAVLAAAPENALAELRRLVIEHIAAVLRARPEQIARTTAFRALGIDSLMGLELRNRLARALDVKLSASTVWNYPTVDQLCAYLAETLGIAAGVPAPAASTGRAGTVLESTFAASAGTLEDEIAEAEAVLASL